MVCVRSGQSLCKDSFTQGDLHPRGLPLRCLAGLTRLPGDRWTTARHYAVPTTDLPVHEEVTGWLGCSRVTAF